MSENQKQSVEGVETEAINIANWFRFFVDKDNHVKPEGIKQLQEALKRLLSQQQLEVVEKVKEIVKSKYSYTRDMPSTYRNEAIDDILQSLSTLNINK